MVSPSNCEIFINLLLTISEYEKSIEILRKILVEQTDFQPVSLFKFMDSENKQFLNENDILRLFQNHSIIPSPLEVKIFLNFYDDDMDGKISFQK